MMQRHGSGQLNMRRDNRMDKTITVLGTIALATLALAIARQLSEQR